MFLHNFLLFPGSGLLDVPQISPLLPELFQLLLKHELSFSEYQSVGNH